MWNIVADGNGNPKLPGTDSCGGSGCRPLVTVNSDGSYSFNQECAFSLCTPLRLPYWTCLSFLSLVYSMAQASKAIIPKDAGGPFGQRIGVSVGGSVGWALRVGAYVTGRSSSSDWSRYSIVVMNCGSLLTCVQSLYRLTAISRERQRFEWLESPASFDNNWVPRNAGLCPLQCHSFLYFSTGHRRPSTRSQLV